MRKLAAVLSLMSLLASCSTFTWEGQGAGLNSEQKERGVKDIAALTRQYETETYWRGVRARRDRLVNAFGRDLAAITSTIDRHVFNASPTDPMINHPTESSMLEHTAHLGLDYTGTLGLGLVGH